MKYRVLTYNVHKGFDTFGVKFILNQIKLALKETNADLCLLQEVVGENEEWKQKHPERPFQAQFEFLADTVWPYYSYGKNAVFTTRHHGNAVLSKYPVIFEKNVDLTLHRLEQRGFLHCRIQIPETQKIIEVINTHLNLREKDRIIQMDNIVNYIKNNIDENSPFIFGGDFNDWNYSINNHLKQQIQIADSHFFQYKNYAKSFPSFMPMVSLDRLYFKNLKLIQTEVFKSPSWSKLSDHLPLFSEYEV